MEHLFAVRVLVHYYDKPKVDHAAVRRLLSSAAVDSLQLIFIDGTSLPLSDHLNTPQPDRKVISELVNSLGSSLVQVASVFMLAEARAASDALCTSPNELETACIALERLLGCLATKRPLLPVRDIKQSARVRLGTSARRRAFLRHSASSNSNNHQVSILKAVNAVLRLCDVATHCLSVVSRQSLTSKTTCQTAVILSTRLLTLAASLYEVQRIDSTPALSFFSSNSLRTTLVAGAMHLGVITIEHCELEPMAWIHIANRIVMRSSTTVAPRTSVLSALFGGMLKTGKRYEIAERDTKAAESALCLLSTLHVVLETDIIRDSLERDEHPNSHSAPSQQLEQSTVDSVTSILSPGPASQAARSFLGERVVAAEEDGDEGRIAARTVYQACEEYAERAGESDGMMGLLSRLFASAGRQCRLEYADEPVVSISEGTLPCPLDESDASSDGPQLRPEAQSFSVDVFDQRSRDGFGTGITFGSNSEIGIEQAERIEIHREVGALALDTLAHWVGSAHILHRYTDLDFTDFSVKICRSASYYVLNNSSASYDLRAAMVDFGSLICPILEQSIEGLSKDEVPAKWDSLVTNLVDSSQRVNPILSGILSYNNNPAVVNSLVNCFLRRSDGAAASIDRGIDEPQSLPIEGILKLLLATVRPESATTVIERVMGFLRDTTVEGCSPTPSLGHRVASFMLLSHSLLMILGIDDGSEVVRIAFASLFHRDVDYAIDPIFPQFIAELECVFSPVALVSCCSRTVRTVVASVKDIFKVMKNVCVQSSLSVDKNFGSTIERSNDVLSLGYSSGNSCHKNEKLLYHFFWSCLMLQKVVGTLEAVSTFTFDRLRAEEEDPSLSPLLSPFICSQSLQSEPLLWRIIEMLKTRQKPSVMFLYVVECTSLLQCKRSGVKEKNELPVLLIALVSNAMDLISDAVYDYTSANYKVLKHSVKLGTMDPMNQLSQRIFDSRKEMFPEFSGGTAEYSCIRLAMSYMRSIGSGNVPDLLSNVVLSAAYLLDHLTEEQLIETRCLLLIVAKHLLFLPVSYSKVSEAICFFSEKLIALAFHISSSISADTKEIIAFIARVCGLSMLVEFDSSSANGIRRICNFASDCGNDVELGSVLGVSFGSPNLLDRFGDELSVWMKESLPKISLTKMLSTLLIPADDSAVAVSLHAESLVRLTEACERSELWCSGTLAGLGKVLVDSKDCFVQCMVRRSIMESATMNEGILAVFQRILGTNDSPMASNILLVTFIATQSLFEQEINASLEDLIRLVNFAVRLTISYGQVSSRSNMVPDPALLEPGLFKLIFSSLERTTARVQNNAKDVASKQIILFLCSLIDSIHAGLYEDRSSFFGESVHQNVRKVIVNKINNVEEGQTEKSGSEKQNSFLPEDSSSQIDNVEDSSKLALCTYTSTGSQFVEQHWYFCYSCDLAGTEGVCSICAKYCHKDCELAYSKFGRFFCDCGAGPESQQENPSHVFASSEDGEGSISNSHDIHGQTLTAGQLKRRKPCQCLKPSSKSESKLNSRFEKVGLRTSEVASFQHERDIMLGTQIQQLITCELQAITRGESKCRLRHGSIIRLAFERILKSDTILNCLMSTALYLAKELDSSHVTSRLQSEWVPLKDVSKRIEALRSSGDLVQTPRISKTAKLTRLFKAGSFEVKSTTSLLDTINSQSSSSICFSPYEKIIAVSIKAHRVEFIDASDLLTSSDDFVEKSLSSTFPPTSIPFTIKHISFHPGNSNLLLAVGLEKVLIVGRVSDKGQISWNHIEVEVGLSHYDGPNDCNALVSASWLNDESTLLLVTTKYFVKIFNVSEDHFCPFSYSKVPLLDAVDAEISSSNDTKLSEVAEKRLNAERYIVASFVISEETISKQFFLGLVTSDGKLFFSRLIGNETSTLTLSYGCCVHDEDGNSNGEFSFGSICYHRGASLLTISYKSGNLLCISIALRLKESGLEAAIHSMHMYKEVFVIGGVTELEWVPGTDTCFMYFQKGHSLVAGGILTVCANKSVEVNSFSGSPATVVRGVAPFAPSSLPGGPLVEGGFLVLDDGSLHRVDMCSGHARSQIPAVYNISTLLERRQRRTLTLTRRHSEIRHGSNATPSPIGFFEKCRRVAEPFTIEGKTTERNPNLSFERMGVILAGGGDSVVSSRENLPFKFSASIEDQSLSLVLVGVRLQFGGTDRSRNRVPSDVKVFGRPVKWQSQNGVKRWLDVPFSVPESKDSPQRVYIELFPPRSNGENDTECDGLVALDTLQLYAVSSVEFTERKLLYDKYIDSLKKKKESSCGEVQKGLPNFENLVRMAFSTMEKTLVFSESQAALLTIMNAIDRKQFPNSLLSGKLLFEVNNLWSVTCQDNMSGYSLYLRHLLKPCVSLFLDMSSNSCEDEIMVSHQSNIRALSVGIRFALTEQVDSLTDDSLLPHFQFVEKALFAVGGLARSLLTAGIHLKMLPLDLWITSYDEIMPNDTVILRLLQAHVSLGRSGRLLYKSSLCASMNTVDIFMAMSIRNSISSTARTNAIGKKVVNILVSMLCSFDQDLRLCVGQRLIEMFDSLNGREEIMGSPFESVLASSLLSDFKSHINPSEWSKPVCIEPEQLSEERDELQSWGYCCDNCGDVCDRERWHCVDCENFDLCTKCLRGPDACSGGRHKIEHSLVRGSMDEDMNDQSGSEEEQMHVSAVSLQAQGVLKAVINEVLSQVSQEENYQCHWRFLDSAETIAQLLAPCSPSELRAVRLNALFDSSFPDILQREAEEVGKSFVSTDNDDEVPLLRIQGNCDIFFLMLRIILSAPGSNMPLFVHKQNIPKTLFSLLENMHGMLRFIVKCLTFGKPYEMQFHSNFNVMLRKVWNRSFSGMVYTILSQRKGSKCSLGAVELFQGTDDVRSATSVFLNMLMEVLHVLEYSFRNATSLSITKQMAELPRNILCDIINFCETASTLHQNNPLFINTAAAATDLLSALSLDDVNSLNTVLDKYLYEEQSKRLRTALERKTSHDRILPYNTAIELAGILQTLHKAASRHPETWRTFVIAKEDVLFHVLDAARSSEGKIQQDALQLLAAGVAVSSEFSSKVMKALPILDLEQNSIVVPHQTEDCSESISLRPESIQRGSVVEHPTPKDLIRAGRNRCQVSTDIFTKRSHELVHFLVQEILLKSQSKDSRKAASHAIVFGIVRASIAEESTSLVKALHLALNNGFDLMPYAGDLADGLMVCLRFFISCCQSTLFGDTSEDLLTALTKKITSLLKKRCSLLISHPNARLYGRLSGFLDLNGYFLESDPCMTCAASTWESSDLRDCRLDNIRAETKYTDSSIMHRLSCIYEVSTISVKVFDPRRTRRVQKIEVFYSSRSVSDAAELKSAEHPWRKLKTLQLGATSTEANVDLIVPVAAANIKLGFSEFHTFSELLIQSNGGEAQELDRTLPNSGTNSRQENSGRNTESLQCPRCSRSVTDRHGICRNCHENAYQCRQCRNINYENLDGFLCNECGYCKHGRFEFSISGRPTHVAESILNEDGRKRASRIIERETSNVHRCMEQLTRIRSSIIKSLVSGTPNDENREKGRILGSARVGHADLLDFGAPRPDIAVLEALLEGQTSQDIEDATNSTQGGVSITEEVIAEGNGSVEVHERDQTHRSGSNIASPTNRQNRTESQSRGSIVDSSIVSRNTSALAVTYAKECRTIFATLSRGIRVLTMTRTELVRYANTVGGQRLLFVSEIIPEPNRKLLINDDDQIGPDRQDTFRNAPAMSFSTVCCYGCTQSFISKCVKLVQTILEGDGPAISIIRSSDLSKDMMLACSLCEKLEVQHDVQGLITQLVNDNQHATELVCTELARKIGFCIDSFETVDSHSVARFEMNILEATACLDDSCWEERLRLVIRILFKASNKALTCSSVAESVILPCLRVALRLLRADSELTVIDGGTTAEDSGNGGDPITNDVVGQNIPESSETGNEDARGPEIASENINSDQMGTNRPERLNRNHNVTTDTSLGSGQDPLGVLVHAPLSGALRQNNVYGVGDTDSIEGREQILRGETDLLTSSNTSLNIRTTQNGRASEEAMSINGSLDQEGIDIHMVHSILESDHDAKMVSTNVGQWLQGKHSQSSWVSTMKRRTITASRKGVQRETTEPTERPSAPMLKHIFNRWRNLRQTNRIDHDMERRKEENIPLRQLSIQKDNWIVRLMLFTPCTAVRKEACTLLELLCGQEEMLQLQLLDVLTGPALFKGAYVGEKSKEFFDLLEATLALKSHRLYLIAKGFLAKLAALIRSGAERLTLCEVEAESSLRLINFLEGYSLKRLVSLLRHTLQAVPSQRLSLREQLFETDDNNLVRSLQRAYICVRKLISMRTKLTDECGAQLCEILLSKEFLFNGPTVSAVVSACVSELKSANMRNDAQAIAILLEELCLMLCPEGKEPTCMLSLNKAPTQEEFIRGSMSRNPYPSSSFDGPLMRDVKNKICRDLDLPGLFEDDFAMELLVAGSLIKLDLPIMPVFEHVWRGSTAASTASIQPAQIRAFGLRRSRGNGNRSRSGGIRSTILSLRRMQSERDAADEDVRLESRPDPPMVVVYRLSGLDGEATEPIIDSLPRDAKSEEDSEELYRDTIILGEVGGLDILFKLLSVVSSWGDDAETAVRAPALRLLRASCAVAQNRALLAKSANAVDTLLDCAASAFEHAQGSPAAAVSAESLLIAAEQILAQQRKELESHSMVAQDSVHIAFHDPSEVMSRVRVFMGRLALATSPKAENSILHLLPFLIQGIPGAVDLVLQHVCFSLETVDISEDEQRKARQLGTVLLATPRDLRGNEFVLQTIGAGIARDAVNYVVRKFPVPKHENWLLWEDSLEGHGPPLILRVLTGLSMFLGTKQEQLSAGSHFLDILKDQPQIIPVLCQLEMAVSESAIGTSAEVLLEALTRDDFIASETTREREIIKRFRREAAEASRTAVLRETGLLSAPIDVNGGPKNVSQKSKDEDSGNFGEDNVLKLLEEVPDEEGPACVVCGDGFQCRPEEALVFYVYCRKVSLDLSNTSNLRSGGESTSNSGQNSTRLEWETWSSTRSRSGSSSKSGTNSCFTTVTHLNAIHVSCHKEAARVDRSSRRDEWDGASLRNSQTKCNNLFPVRPPLSLKSESSDTSSSLIKASASSYCSAVEGYFSRLSSLGRTSVTHAKAVSYDLGQGLLRFAEGGTGVFSEHARGGGPHSNACLIPHLVQLAIYLIEVAGSSRQTVFTGNTSLQTQEAALAKYLQEGEVGDMAYYLASSLVLQSLGEWEKCISMFLRRGMRDHVMEHKALLRLIAFSDIANRALKHGICVETEQHWLYSLRKHIGTEETFAQTFGDLVNEKWETYIRGIHDTATLLDGLEENMKVGTEVSENEVMIIIENVKLCLNEEKLRKV